MPRPQCVKMVTCTYWGAAFIMVLKSFHVHTARVPIKVYRALGSNLLSLLTSLLPLSHTLQFPGQLVPCKEWGSYKLLSEWPQELSTSSETTSTMGVPPPFLLLFGTEYVRLINVLAAKNLGIHTGLCGLWVQLKRYGVWIQKTWLCPFGRSSSFSRAVLSFGLLIDKMDIILYPDARRVK